MMVNGNIYWYLNKYKGDLENDAFLFICGNCAKELMPGNTILIFWKIFGFETPRHQKEEMDGTMSCVFGERKGHYMKGETTNQR